MWHDSCVTFECIGANSVPFTVGPALSEAQLTGISSRELAAGWASEAVASSEQIRRQIRSVWIGENAVSVGAMPKPEVLGKLDSLSWISGVAMEFTSSVASEFMPVFVTHNGTGDNQIPPSHASYQWRYRLITEIAAKRGVTDSVRFGTREAKAVAKVVADYDSDDVVIERPLVANGFPNVTNPSDLVSEMLAKGRTAIVFQDVATTLSKATPGSGWPYDSVNASYGLVTISVPAVVDGLAVIGVSVSFDVTRIAQQTSLYASTPVNPLSEEFKGGALNLGVSFVVGTPAIRRLLSLSGVGGRVYDHPYAWSGGVSIRAPLTGKTVFYSVPGSDAISCGGRVVSHMSGCVIGGPAWASEFVYKGIIEKVTPTHFRLTVSHAGIEFDGNVLSAAVAGSEISTEDVARLRNSYIRTGLVPAVTSDADPLSKTTLFSRCRDADYNIGSQVLIAKGESTGGVDITFAEASKRAASITRSIFHQFRAASIWGADTFTSVRVTTVVNGTEKVPSFSGVDRNGNVIATSAEDCVFSIKLGAPVTNLTPEVLSTDLAFHAATGKTLLELLIATGNIGLDAEFNEGLMFWADIIDPSTLNEGERNSFFMIHESHDRSVMDKVAVTALAFGRASLRSAKQWFK